MRRPMLIVAMSAGLLVVGLAGAPRARAAEGGTPAAPSEADLRIDMSGIGLPIFKDGKVVNYIFIRARIQLNPGLSKTDIETRQPFLQERLVRAAYKSPLNKPEDLMTVDPKTFEAVLFREARSVLGANKVKSVELRDQKPQKMLYTPPQSGGNRSRAPIP